MTVLRKVFLAILILIFTGGWLCAEGQQESSSRSGSSNSSVNSDQNVRPEAGASITVWETAGPNLEFMKWAANEFEKETGVSVRVEEVSDMAALNKMSTDGPAGRGADVFSMTHDGLGTAVSSGLIMPNLVTSTRVKTEFMSAASRAVTYENKIYGFPHTIETIALFYNKDLLPNAPETFEEIVSFGRGWTNFRKNKYGLVVSPADLYTSYAFMTATGGYLFGNNGTNPSDIGLNKSGAIAGLNALLSLKPVNIQKSMDITSDVTNGLFTEGFVGAIISGPWSVYGFKKAGLNFGVTPLPTIDGKRLRPFSGVKLYAVSSYTKFPRAAQLFAKYLTTNEMLLERFKRTDSIPPATALLGNPVLTSDPFVKAFVDQAQYSDPMPNIPAMQYCWDPFQAAMADVWDGSANLQTAMDNAVKVINDQMDMLK